MKLLLLVYLLIPTLCYSSRVKIKEGELIGTTYTLPNGKEVFAFLGIPYADPPTGANRFKQPKPPKPWKKARNATSMGNLCAQTLPSIMGGDDKPIGEENCLFINVFTPKIPQDATKNKLMNVMVYIHGGGFVFGGANDIYPDGILQHEDIVFVSMNYRLGVLGFFSANDPLAAGNFGLKDQVEALRWVKRNIRYFGGDPKKVTIYGSSAGGASVHYHLLSPLNNPNHFQNAISSSGSVSLPWSLPKNVVNNSLELAKTLNCYHRQVNLMMKCLRNAPIDEIIEKGYEFARRDDMVESIPYGPIVEPRHSEAFLPEDPYTLMKKGKIQHVPWMTSMTENEGIIIRIGIATNETYMNEVDKKWNQIAPKLFSYTSKSKSEQDHIASSIRKYYLGTKSITNHTMKHLFQALGDRYFYNGIISSAKLHSKSTPENTYCFKFYYRGSESITDFFPNTNRKNYGACHCDDGLYVFNHPNGKNKTKLDSDMTNLLSSSIIAFMKNGDPSTIEMEWKPISKKDKMDCLVIYSNTYQRMEDIENHDTTRLWNALLPHEDPEDNPRKS